MQIDTTIDLRGNVYHAETAISRLTPRELDLISQFGGPVIETGGTISATVTRPQVLTATKTKGLASIPVGVVVFQVAFGGTLAAVPTQVLAQVIADPAISEITVVSVVPSAITDQGFTVNLSGPVNSSGYTLSWEVNGAVAGTSGTPVAVSFTLPSAPRRLSDEFPAKYTVSLDDDEEADIKAAAWRSVIESRITAAKAALLTKDAAFVGAYRQTV